MITGLTAQEAAARLQEYGPNQIVSQKPKPAWLLFLLGFNNPLMLLLLGASAVSAYFGEVTSSLIIVAVVIASALLNFINTYKSDKAAQHLTERVTIQATVLRDGQVIDLALAMVVPGDIVVLRAGKLVPADGQLIESQHLYLNESSLTGESFPQSRQVGMTVSMGSSVVSGEGLAKVTATGNKTAFSRVAQSLSLEDRPTEFDREMKDFSLLTLKITFALVMAVFFINVWLKGTVLESLLFAVALAVGLTPELLPMIIAANLTKGSLTMAKHGVIVKRLAAIQNFGSMDVLCTDKTGTLTEDKIVLVKHLDGYGKTCQTVLKFAYLNSALAGTFSNPLDEAIKDFKTLPVGTFHKVDELPFDFERKRQSVIADHAGQRLLIAKGAPEELLAISLSYGPDRLKMTTVMRQDFSQQYHQLSDDGFRVLGIAMRTIDHKSNYSVHDEKQLTFLGFVAFLDPPKKTAAAALRAMHDYGIAVKIVTGDNELVSQKVAAELDLPITGVMLGSELAKLTDHQLRLELDRVTLFARVNPEQKLRIIQQLQAAHHVVGYIGDGINDAPSLKAADVGISVNNAVDIAKESADLILLHKNLSDLTNGVLEGRKTFSNTLKYLMMVLSSNFGNVFSMAIASLFLPFLPMLPPQILLNNLLYDGSQFALPADSVDAADIRKPQRLSLTLVKRFMYIFGPISSLFDILTFGSLYFVFRLTGSGFQTGWFLESLLTQVLVVYVIRTKKVPFLQSNPALALFGSTVIAISIGWLIALTKVGHAFGFSPIPGLAIVTILAITVGYLLTIEITKRLFYRFAVA